MILAAQRKDKQNPSAKTKKENFKPKISCPPHLWAQLCGAAGAQRSPLSLRTFQSLHLPLPSSRTARLEQAVNALCRWHLCSIKPDWFVFYLPSSHARSHVYAARILGNYKVSHFPALCVTTGLGQADKENSLLTDMTTEKKITVAPLRPSCWLLLRFSPHNIK